ncbi:MAG: ABC transporter permease, partial [Deltaproteobacteria bacterium]|nr:ABC transporter permease [Deltaproteobacteria bacterium]
MRSIKLIFVNEFRLLIRDRASLFMLFIAPIVIIAVAGFSLANLFGTPAARNDCMLAVVDQDHGSIATAIIDALARERSCKLVKVSDLDAARRLVLNDARAPLALFIPPHTTTAFESGQTVKVEVLVDPVKRLQASILELRLNALSQHLASAAQMQMRQQLASRMAELHAYLEEARAQSRTLELAIRDYRHKLGQARGAAQQAVRAKIQHQLDALETKFQASIAEAIALTQQQLDRAVAEKRTSLIAIEAYLRALSISKAEFDQWLARLKVMAGAEAERI